MRRRKQSPDQDILSGVVLREDQHDRDVMSLVSQLLDYDNAEELDTRASYLSMREVRPYQYDFLEFLKHCCFTVDEASGGQVRPFPGWYPCWRDLSHWVFTDSLVFVEKSRRVLVSWFMTCLDIWIAAGGVDPRWKNRGKRILESSSENRVVYLAALKAEGDTGTEWFIEKRCCHILEMFEKYCRDSTWKDFPSWTHKAGEISFSNGGRIKGLPAGEDAMRGATGTFLHMEEVAFWERAKECITAALPIRTGGGHVVAVTTAKVGTFAKTLREGGKKGVELPVYTDHMGQEVTSVLPSWVSSMDWRVVRLHYSCVNNYDLESARTGLTEDGVRAELEIDWSASTNKRVYPEFANLHIAPSPIRFDPTLPLLCGWDVGNQKAFIATQLTMDGIWNIWNPVTVEDDETVGDYEFAEQVYAFLVNEFALPAGVDIKRLTLMHWGDPMGNSVLPTHPSRFANPVVETRAFYHMLRSGTRMMLGEDQSGRKIIEDRPGFGWSVQPGKVSIRERVEPIRQRLVRLVNGRPALQVCPTATTVIEGFMGGYHYGQRADGRYDLDPKKNFHSHYMDALGYIASRMDHVMGVWVQEDEDEGDSIVRKHQYKSLARIGR